MKSTLTTCLLFVFLGTISAQADLKSDSLKAEGFFNEGVSLRANGVFEEAIQAFDSAMSYFLLAQDTGLYFITLTDKSWCYILTGQFENALELCDLALEETDSFNHDSKELFYRQKGIIYSNQSEFDLSLQNFLKAEKINRRKYGTTHNRYARSLGDLSVVYDRTGQYDKALEYRMRSIEIHEKNGTSVNNRINSNLNLGALYYKFGDYKKCLDYSVIALELSLNNENEVKSTTANLYENIGNCYKSMGQYEKAIEYYNKTLSLRKEIFGDSHYKIANTYQNLGGSYTQLGERERTLEMYKKSYEMRVSTLGESHIRTIEGLKHLGIGHLDLEEFDLAEKYLKEALELESRVFGENKIETCLTLNNLGHLNRRSGKLENAIQYDQQAANIFEGLYGTKGVLLSRIYESMARTYFEMKDYGKAIEVLNKSMVANGMKVGGDGYNPPNIDNYLLLRTVLESIMLKIEILEEANLEVNTSELITQHVDTVSKMIGKVKHDFSNKSDLFFLIEIYHDFAGKAVEHTYALFEKTGNRDLIFKALEYMESAKDNLLTQKLYHISARDFSGVPDSILVQEKLIKSQLENANTQLIVNDSLKQIHNENIFELNRKFESLTDLLKKDYPNYYQLNYVNKGLSPNDINAFVANQNAQIISFFQGNEHLYSVHISDQEKILSKQSLSDDFEKKVVDFRKAISDVDDDRYQSLSNDLYVTLIGGQKLSNKNENLVIVPDGSLSTIPFELLQTGEEVFLFENHNISYTSSLKYLISIEKRTLYNEEYVGFAPKFDQAIASADPIRNELSSIPGAVSEINNITELLDGTSYLNENASETNFRNISDKYGMIHLATHAIIDDANPDASKLVFSLKGDSLNDGYLHAYEIYNLDLNASLITLSACNTGFGEVRKGEGVMSLSRAFAYAGVPSTVVSLWPASDKSTPELMKLFYQNLKDGQAKDVALNNARKQYLSTATGKARHPFYWGGFVLIGDNQPLKSGSSNMIWMMLLFIAVIATSTVVRRRKK